MLKQMIMEAHLASAPQPTQPSELDRLPAAEPVPESRPAVRARQVSAGTGGGGSGSKAREVLSKLMKKPITIVAAVGGLSLLEVALLLISAVPRADVWAGLLNLRPGGTLLVGVLIMPGIATLISVLMHGPQRWHRRAVRMYAVPAGVASVLIGAIALPNEVDAPPGVELAYLLIVFVGGTVCLLVAMWKRTRRTAFGLDVVHWHLQRESACNAEVSRRTNRSIRYALWIPSLTVLLVLLFLPESLGLASHLIYAGTDRIGEYRVPLPITAMVVPGGDQNPTVCVALVGTGIARDLRILERLRFFSEDFPLDFPISNWVFRIHSSGDWEHRRAESNSRVVAFEGTQLTCAERRGSYGWPVRSSLVSIDCHAPNGFAASLEGDAAQVPAFYRVISGITRVQR